MEYSSDKVMSRKAYLKSKKKGKFGFRIIKYVLLLTVIVLLSIYLFKQLDVYNNVTKIANKVVEETALSKTMTMYYLADGYTKDSLQSVVLYKSFDESRTKIEGTEGFSNIKINNGVLYGIFEEKLYSINLETHEKIQTSNLSVKDYVIFNGKIYCYVENAEAKEKGIYVYEGNDKEPKLLININAQQFLVDENYIFIISKGKTEKSIIRYNSNGSGRTVLTDKEIVTYMKQDKNNIYYVAGEQLYTIGKNGNENSLILEEKIYIDSDIKNNTSTFGAFEIKGDVIYYIIKADEKKLNAFNMKTKEKQEISKKDVESIELNGNILYYKINNGIGIYKVNIENGKTEQVTNIRGTEYICFN